MKYCYLFSTAAILVVITSCSSAKMQELSLEGLAYQEEYKANVEQQLDSLQPNLFYQSHREQVIVPAGSVRHIKKSDTE